MELFLSVWLSSFGTAGASTFDEWVQAHNLPSAASDPADNPAGDDIPNLLKFAMGLEPLTSGPRPFFEPIIVDRNGQQLVGLRLPLASGAQGVRLSLYGSENLRTWTPRAVVLEQLADLGSGVLRVQLLDNQALSGSQPLFLRLGADLTSYGQFITSPAIPVFTDSVGTNGAMLTVQAPGTPLDALALDVPAAAYPGPQTFTISYAPIVAHNFPASINPATPLIHIENGGGPATQIMTVTIPLSRSPDDFAMGFIYHADTGELEGMPLLALSTNSITIATRHFSSFFISRIAYSLLPKKADSGFRPGLDDWEFTNYGSFLEHDGECSGECQSEMWYYCNRRLKRSPPSPPLFNHYENSLYSFRTPGFGSEGLGLDDVLGIKLASRVQNDTDWHGLLYWFWKNNLSSAFNTLEAFTYSIWVTGEPQETLIFSPSGGHALVAYRVENGSNGAIYVADPNSPGVTTNKIVYDVTGGQFQPYVSGANAAHMGTPYPNIYYGAKTTINDWAKIEQRWFELDRETIANSDFPVFKISLLELQGGAWVPTRSVTTDNPTETPIQTGADQVDIRADYVSGPAILESDLSVFDNSGANLKPPATVINLDVGTHRLGVEVKARQHITEDLDWAAFAWLTVQRTNAPYTFKTLAGRADIWGGEDGTSNARFNSPYGVAVDIAGNVYVGDFANDTIRLVTSAGAVTTLAGEATLEGSADGSARHARFFNPTGVAVDTAGNVYVADEGNNTIRMVTLDGQVETLAGLAGISGSVDGTGSLARFDGPSGVAVDSAGNIYVADTYNHTIRKVTPTREVTKLAGQPGIPGSANGDPDAAQFNTPHGLAVDSAGNIYVADSRNYTIRKVTPTGVVTDLAGLAGSSGSADGTGSAATFGLVRGVAVDSAGNVYVADEGNHTIRKVTSAGVVTTLAGLPGTPGSADGTGSAARFCGPQGVAMDTAGNVYVADSCNGTIRRVTPSGAVTTLAGQAGEAGRENYADGTGRAARLAPVGVAVDSAGNIYVADGTDTIRKGYSASLAFGAIEGFVTNILTGTALTNVLINSGFGATTNTDSTGYYRLDQAPLGANNAGRTWSVTAAPNGFPSQTKSVVVSSNTVSRLDFAFGQAPASLIVTASGVPDPVLVSSNLLYTVTLQNKGADAANVRLTDTLPPAVTFLSASVTNSDGGSFREPAFSNGVVTTTTTNFSSNAIATLFVSVQPTAPGSLTNLAVVTSDTPDLETTGSNHTAVVTTTVNAPGPLNADLALVMTGAPNPVLVGNQLTYTLVVANAGPADALIVTLDDTLPVTTSFFSTTTSQGTTTESGADFHWDIGPLTKSASATATLIVVPGAAGTITNSATVAHTDSGGASVTDMNLANNSASVVIAVNAPAVTNVSVQIVAPIMFNRQTGLFEQPIQFNNLSGTPVTGVRISLGGLPSDLVLYNASGASNGVPFVACDQTVAAGGSVGFVLEYYRSNRLDFVSTNFTATAVAATTPSAPTGTMLQLDRDPFLSSGELVIEFASSPGGTYCVQYSADMQTWKTAEPSIVAAGTRVQWADAGPPKTESLPGPSGQRFYRIVQLP